MSDVSSRYRDPDALAQMYNKQLYGSIRDVPVQILDRRTDMDHADQPCVIERSSWYCGDQVIGPFASLRDADGYAVRAGRGEGGPRWRSAFWVVALVSPEAARETIASYTWHDPPARRSRHYPSWPLSGLRTEDNPDKPTWEWDGPCVVMGQASLALGNHRPVGPFSDTAEAIAYGEELGIPDHIDWFVEALVRRNLEH
jgi:hypothetical protein